jgi:dolichol-phosphate mannosyltransferase
VLVPTRNEAGNAEELLRRVSAALAGIQAEILLVDDSDDETPGVVRLRARSGVAGACGVKLVHRQPGPARNGLGGAVVDGLRCTTARWVCVMDADLQHPPEVIPLLLATGEQHGADLVVASRYADGGDGRGLSLVRSAVSRASTLTAKMLFPRRLRDVSDPMSGFFIVRRDAVGGAGLRPLGFKILLELIVRQRDLRVMEVGFTFGSRYAGESKGSIREGLRYLRHLCRLRAGGPTAAGDRPQAPAPEWLAGGRESTPGSAPRVLGKADR